ncbi:MAG: glycosyltransferase [Candidatus Levyibacteriota bacterium]|nr:MAG: glycosyltransferase [Candidatus Levybacteria bacterium]
MNKMYYKNIFMYSNHQSTATSNIEEYFVLHTNKLVVFVLDYRKLDTSLVRLYKNGSLVEEKKVKLSQNRFGYYLLWYVNYLIFLMTYFTSKEKVIVISWSPISFFGMFLQKKLRNIDFLFWDGDYFPPVNISLRLFEGLKRYYNQKVKYAFYSGDLINEKMNGKVLNTPYRKTALWGVMPRNIKRKLDKKNLTILFVGFIKDSQDLEFLFDFLKGQKNYKLKIIGMCDGDLDKKYNRIIKENGIENQVYFPNRFFSDKELEDVSKTCQVGIALYDITPTNGTYYTDPGKVKTYASFGLPIIMSDMSAIAPYIKRFNCGILIKKNDTELGDALLDMRKNYTKYLKGLEKFNDYFYYETHYRKALRILEKND